ncbi:hypothetical protein SAMN05443572_10744 [Myxococcus fulvus]|uniref:Uncharacterized protein n=1 Tax=Myxococcus fulvus TaxID=33 RepID=A0ABY1CMX4_MYXFU|nr:hypothetical protein SAMN05443572_10744 [Myxococcus fulvus]
MPRLTRLDSGPQMESGSLSPPQAMQRRESSRAFLSFS